MYQIQVLNNVSARGLSKFPKECYHLDENQADPDAILVRSADLHHHVFGNKLKAIARAGAGVNNIPVETMSKRGVPVFNAPGANANAVKELVLAAMLISVRNLDAATRFVDKLDPNMADLDAHVEAKKKLFVGSELAGRTLGVVGLGAIGVKVANAAHALGMKVLGFDPHMTVEGAWRLSSDVIQAASLSELFAGSDFISFHVPLNNATRGIFSESSLAIARKGVVLLNFSRDGIIAPEALKAGLDNGTIGKYASDFPHGEWITHPRVLAFPHLGASTNEAEENCALMVVDQLRDYLENGNISNAVNFPNMRLARVGQTRVCVANQNRPNMIGQLSHVFGAESLNIAQMQNASRGELAYNIVDVDNTVEAHQLKAISAIDGILSVRLI
jgi:D-3-phosphoglycerate dehydrogenase